MPDIQQFVKTEVEADVTCFPLYDGPRAIAAAKKADLLELMVHLPSEKQQYYRTLEADAAAEDSGEELEIEGGALPELE